MSREYIDTETALSLIADKPIVVAELSRMRYSSGVMTLVDLDSTLRVRIDGFWGSNWNTKRKTLSREDFNTWVSGRLNARRDEFIKLLSYCTVETT